MGASIKQQTYVPVAEAKRIYDFSDIAHIFTNVYELANM